MADILLSPWLWVVLLALWLWWWWTGRSRPHIHRKYDSKYKHRFKPGDLFADGSTATSKTEKRVLESLHRYGLRTLPSSTRILIPEVATRPGTTGNKDKTRMFTPDIMLLKQKVIVEVDPIHWHGGEERIIHDIERNMGYSALGYAIVRVRIGWQDQPYSKLGPYDVVTAEQDYDAERHAARVIKQIRQAKPINPKYWAQEHAQLTAITPHDPTRRR